jgi:hypothetical protein
MDIKPFPNRSNQDAKETHWQKPLRATKKQLLARFLPIRRSLHIGRQWAVPVDQVTNSPEEAIPSIKWRDGIKVGRD